MTRLLASLRPCPLRVVTAEEIRAVAGSSRETRMYWNKYVDDWRSFDFSNSRRWR